MRRIVGSRPQTGLNMAAPDTDWYAIRTGLLTAAAGLAAGAILCLYVPLGGAEYALGVAAILGLASFFAFYRARKHSEFAFGAREQANVSPLPDLAREVFEQLPDPLMLIDAAGNAVFANRPMLDITGTDSARKHVSSLLRAPDVLDAIARTSATGEPSSAGFSLPVPVARYFQAYAVRTQREPHFVALLVHDMTSVRRAEQARADFVANASHELRTPLAALSGFIDTLRGHARDDPAAREKFLGIMGVEAGRMRRLIDDLLSLNRIELNENIPPSGTVDIAGVVRDAANALAPLAQSDNIAVTVTAADRLPKVNGTRDELTQLFQNLIHNAIKYGKPGGHVWVTLSAAPGLRGGEVAVAVKDDGEGIPREAIPRLTERFYRVDVKRSREKGGTGLGLAIVKHIVSRHKGRLQIESAPGEGSAFTVFLPAAESAEELADGAVTQVL